MAKWNDDKLNIRDLYHKFCSCSSDCELSAMQTVLLSQIDKPHSILRPHACAQLQVVGNDNAFFADNYIDDEWRFCGGGVVLDGIFHRHLQGHMKKRVAYA